MTLKNGQKFDQVVGLTRHTLRIGFFTSHRLHVAEWEVAAMDKGFIARQLISKMIWLYTLALTSQVGVMPLCAQSPSDLDRESVPLIRVSPKLVLLDAIVENKKTGELIGTLSQDDFRIYDDGVPQQISYFSHDQLPLSVVFLFDLTDTVRPILKPLADATHEVLNHLKPEDETAIMVFSSHTELLQDFTTDRSLAADAIEKAAGMKSREGTFIHEDMHEAIQQAVKSTIPGSRRVLVWLTDGTANFENSLTQKTIGKSAPAHLHSKAEAIDELEHSAVVVAALIERSARTDAMIAAADANPLAFIVGARVGDIRRYADMTGGPVLNTSKTKVAARLALLIDQLRNRYTFGYKPGDSRGDERFRKLQVVLGPTVYKEHPSLTTKDIVVRTKTGYFR